MAKVIRKCEQCGREYASKNIRSRYCTQSCGVKARRIAERNSERGQKK